MTTLLPAVRSASRTSRSRSGRPRLGARPSATGTSFGLWAPRATRVQLSLVAEDRTQVHYDMSLGRDGVWTLDVPGVDPGQRYGFRVHGEWAPDRGARFNPTKLLVDPYARAITAGVDYSGPIRDHVPGSDYVINLADDSAAVPLSVVVADSPPPERIARPVPLADSVVYELHVKGFTQLHPAVPEHLRGTYAGLAYPAVVEYLKELGVTAVELLPVHHFVSEPHLIALGLTNYWGYNTLGFFAPHGGYCSVGTLGQQVAEFKAMVTAFHRAGIEVILDVVYNHTGEGSYDGPTLAFRGIDHAGFYRLTPDLTDDYDVTGCGNSVDTSDPGALRLVLDSLRYWVTEMGVDGFRFDLVTTLLRDDHHQVDQEHPFKQALRADPVLNRVKIIAEPWDLGPYGYQVGAFGPGWSEWNDRFRGYVRDFWRHSASGVAELARRLGGSPDLYAAHARPVSASVNYLTAHDGFTLRDLVSYDRKHNEANGEANRDGSDDNRSWNCGVEGETDDAAVVALRHRQARNLMATLLIAGGVPMITAGDEFGRTQSGNNNAYCQDGPLSWVHWDTLEEWGDLAELTRLLLRLRAEHPVFRRDRYRHGEPIPNATGQANDRKNLAWFGERGLELTERDWADEDRTTLGMYLADDEVERERDEAYLIWFHAGAEPVEIALPDGCWADSYAVVAHTGTPGELSEDKIPAGERLLLPGRTVAVLRVD